MKLSTADIDHIAMLARLALTKEEKACYAEQLSVIFSYVDMLNEVDTENVEETCQVTGLLDVVREDEVRGSDEETKKKIIASFPQRMGRLLKVKAVFQQE